MIKRTLPELIERLDGIGSELVRASAITEEEAESAASSPWLYARVRSRIGAERDRREAGERWFALLTVSRRAVPAMALAAAVAFGLFWFSGPGAQQPAGEFSYQALFAANDAGVERVVFADRRALSSDEVLETIISGEREATK